MQNTNKCGLRTEKNCFRGINILPTIQLFNLLFGKTVPCVTFVDTKAVAMINMYMVSAV